MGYKWCGADGHGVARKYAPELLTVAPSRTCLTRFRYIYRIAPSRLSRTNNGALDCSRARSNIPDCEQSALPSPFKSYEPCTSQLLSGIR
jgi:hypothetical protein